MFPSLRVLVLWAVAFGNAGCLFSRMVYYNTPSLSATTYFDQRTVEASTTPSPIPRTEAALHFRLTAFERTLYQTFDELLETNDTRAFLVVQDDRILYERYFGGINEQTALPAFSITKSFAALLVGCAVDDKIFDSAQDRVAKYVPDLDAKVGYRNVTIDQLLRMTSGIDFEEESTAGAMFYYSKDLPQRTYSYDVKWPPGTHYLYGSVNIQILWDALHRHLGGQSVSRYFQKRVWEPMGAVTEASWALDSSASGVEKFFAGLSATARDQARLGLLFLHQGVLNDRNIVSASWVRESVRPDPVAGVVKTSDGLVRRGKYQWFLTLDGEAYFAKGYHGQYIFVIPRKCLVFVRFGEGYGRYNWPTFFLRLAQDL